MHVRKFSVCFFLFCLLSITTASLAARADAQAGNIVLTVSVPEFMKDVFTDEVLSEFEVQNPGVSVQVVTNMPFFASPQNGLERYLDDIESYVSSADVVYVDSSSISVEGTRAGYFLDLTPLASVDPTLNQGDFIPAIWQAFQWDNSLWALPTSANVVGFVYDPAAFDAAGLPYPSPAWTMDDIANAARALAQHGSNNEVTQPGMVMFRENFGVLMRSLLGQGLYDPNTLPNAPLFTNPQLESLLTTWAELETDGVVSTQPDESYSDIPLRVGGAFEMFTMPGSDDQRAGALLPGGGIALDTQGFAVSAGTLYPEQAYALAKFMTNSPQVANSFLGVVPARQSLRGVQGTDDTMMRIPLSPEIAALVDQSLTSGISLSEMRYTSYLTGAVENMVANGTDAFTALQAAEAAAVENLHVAETMRSTTTIAVATPVPTPVLAPGEIVINFGMVSFLTPLPNREGWTQVLQDFAAADPQVGQVLFDTANQDSAEAMAEAYDCFYLPYNAVPDIDLQTILNLDPFLDADSSFERSDVVGSTMIQLMRDNRTWAFPVMIAPQVMRYDAKRFARNGAPIPENGWTIDAFVEALHALKNETGDSAPFSPRDVGGNYLLLLMAAYGGVPIDYRTNPPTLDFTSEATVNAARQVLDLAKDGYIDYQELGNFGAVFMIAGNGREQPPIYTQSLDGGENIRITIGGDDANEPVYAMTTFPRGNQYTGIAYDIGTAYISAGAQNPEACYRWISYIAQHPELFSGMPARRSFINSASAAAAQGESMVSVFNQLDALMQDPNTLIFPTPFSGSSPLNFLVGTWLNQAFDRYVLEDGDLETALQNAQVKASTFQQCAVNIPPYDPAAQTRNDWFNAYTQCAVTADPSLAEVFAGQP